ncbi:MAG: hypothetical protein AABY22_21915 [Nanoarchaeota archaeon]
MTRLPETLVRGAIYNEDIEKVLYNFDERFERLDSMLGNTIPFGLYSRVPEPYFILISQQKDRWVSEFGYNVLLSITSESSELNENLFNKLKERTKLDLYNVPFLESLAKKKNYLLKGSKLDIDRAARDVLRDWQRGKIVLKKSEIN